MVQLLLPCRLSCTYYVVSMLSATLTSSLQRYQFNGFSCTYYALIVSLQWFLQNRTVSLEGNCPLIVWLGWCFLVATELVVTRKRLDARQSNKVALTTLLQWFQLHRTMSLPWFHQQYSSCSKCITSMVQWFQPWRFNTSIASMVSVALIVSLQWFQVQ